MSRTAQIFAAIISISLLYRAYLCHEMKLFKSNFKNSGIVETRNVRSLLECSVLYQKSPNILSFNYHKNDKICELSSFYPETSTTENDWKVYAHIGIILIF